MHTAVHYCIQTETWQTDNNAVINYTDSVLCLHVTTQPTSNWWVQVVPLQYTYSTYTEFVEMQSSKWNISAGDWPIKDWHRLTLFDTTTSHHHYTVTSTYVLLVNCSHTSLTGHHHCLTINDGRGQVIDWRMELMSHSTHQMISGSTLHMTTVSPVSDSVARGQPTNISQLSLTTKPHSTTARKQ